MPIELEAKFLNINPPEFRQRLAALGYSCSQPEYLMRRVVFELPDGDNRSWARVRDEAGTITVSFKRTHDITRVDGTEEIQITADNFDMACKLLTAFGLVQKAYQETKREVWVRGDIELTIDEWPALAPFTEIEAPNAASLQAAASELGLDWQQALFGPVGAAYETIGISHQAINHAPLLTFENVAEILKLKSVA